MILPKKEITFLKKKLKDIQNPLLIHDSDGDGLGAYLLLNKFIGEGRSLTLRSAHFLDANFMKYIRDYHYDSIFVLDIAVVQQDFLDAVKVPVYWIDHHPVKERTNVHYFNPRKQDEKAYIPTTRLVWEFTGKEEDIWVAMIGCLADHYMPDFADRFQELYPDLMKKGASKHEALFESPIGELVKCFFFIQKGLSSEDVRKNISALRKVKSPYEILNQSTPAGKYVWKKFDKVNREYKKTIDLAKKQKSEGGILLFQYPNSKYSYTANLANELTSLNPEKVIMIARNHDHKMKISLRCAPGKDLSIPLKLALGTVDGRGGGHPQACGAVINEDDWKLFLENFKLELKEAGVI